MELKVSSRGTLATAYSGRDNAFNFIRLFFALAVLVGHAHVLGFGDSGDAFSIPIDLGGLAIAGFFALSGFLITRSGRRTPFLRYWWHRILRIFPGFWVCLLVTAGVAGPLLWYHRHGSLQGYLATFDGPLGYIRQNVTTDQRQMSIGDTLAGAPNGALNGSLWTLKYELVCYVLVAVLALIAVLRRARSVVLLMAAVGFGILCYDFVRSPREYGPLPDLINTPTGRITVPLGGTFILWYVVMLTTAFLLGAVAELYREHVPVNDVLGAVSLVLVVVAIQQDLPVLGPALLAYIYLLLWLGIRLPGVFRRVGRHNDYSYGVYIYAFLVQQMLAVFGVPRFGMLAYLGASVVVSLGVAMLSWHLVEKPALRLKDWTPPFLRRAASLPPEPVAEPVSEAVPALPVQRSS